MHSYEFDSEQNDQLKALYGRMKMLALMLLLGGALVLVSGSTLAVHLLFSEAPLAWALSVLLMGCGGLVLILLGLLLQKSAAGFLEIVETQGADISHLMRALGQMRRVFEISTGLAALMIVALFGVMGMLLNHASPIF